MKDDNTVQQEVPLTPAEAAKYLGVTRRTLTRYRLSGQLHAAISLPSGHFRYSRADLDAFRSQATA